MRIEQLEYVTSVARHGSFRRAAEELHISQAALSETVRKLESELGVDILDRRRSGATISEDGRELLPHMQDAIDAVDRLRRAAGDRHRQGRTVRLGTVTAATVPLMTPTIREFHESHPATLVEIVTAQQSEIHRSLLEGSFDLGLGEHVGELGARPRVRREELLAQSLVAMRSGYVMHRYLHRLFGGEEPPFSYSADGAEMGKLMVASGLGVAVLPDYSVIGDPLAERGDIAYREIEGDETEVLLVLHRRRAGSTPQPVRDLHELFVRRARVFAHEGLETGEREAARRTA